jgi:hypothetical protein
MRRIAIGVVWFLVLFIGISGLLGGIAGSLANREAGAAADQRQTPQDSFETGRIAGQKLGRKFGPLILLGSLALAISGTAFGVLPGTKPRKQCPHCAETIMAAATVCRHCGRDIGIAGAG